MHRSTTMLIPALLLGAVSTGLGAQETIQPTSLPNVDVIAIGTIEGEFGEMFSDLLAEALLDARQFRVVDRERTADLMQEHRIRSTGLISPQEAIQLGQFTGAQAYVFGRVVDVQEQRYTSRLDLPETRVTVEIQARVIDLRTAEVLASEHIVRTLSSESARGVISDGVSSFLLGRRRVERTQANPVELRARAFRMAATDFAAALQR